MDLGEIPDDVPEVEIELGDQSEIWVNEILRRAGLVVNGKAAKDALGRGVVFADGDKVESGFKMVAGDIKVIQAGKKKIARVTVK